MSGARCDLLLGGATSTTGLSSRVYSHGDQLGRTTFAIDETQTLTAPEQDGPRWRADGPPR